MSPKWLLSLTVLPKSHIQNPIKSLCMVEFFAKIFNNFQLLAAFAKKPHHKCQTVVCKEKRNKLFYFAYFYIILYDFINCPALVDIKGYVCYFYQFFIFSPNYGPSKTMKDVFISSKKLFSFLRYSNFCNFPHTFQIQKDKWKWNDI